MLAKLKEDAGLRDKLQVAADLDAAGAIAKEAGFDVTKADWLKFHQASQRELSDEDLEGAVGGLDDDKGEDLEVSPHNSGSQWS